MVISMLQFSIELHGVTSIKEKRHIVNSLKDRLRTKFRVSVAEVDLHDSLGFTQIGVALVSNSKSFGESVMHKAVDFVDSQSVGRLQDFSIFTEIY
jgi:uncharacterized protein YlxP (DUF503 family)